MGQPLMNCSVKTVGMVVRFVSYLVAFTLAVVAFKYVEKKYFWFGIFS
jgi:uncharacterized membrane protein